MTLENIKNTQEEINSRLKQTLDELHELRLIISREVPNREDTVQEPEIVGDGLLNQTLRAQRYTNYLLINLNFLKEDLYDLIIETNSVLQSN